MNEQKNTPHYILNNGYTDLSLCFGIVECLGCGYMLDPYGWWGVGEYECPACGDEMPGVNFIPYANDETDDLSGFVD